MKKLLLFMCFFLVMTPFAKAGTTAEFKEAFSAVMGPGYDLQIMSSNNAINSEFVAVFILCTKLVWTVRVGFWVGDNFKEYAGDKLVVSWKADDNKFVEETWDWGKEINIAMNFDSTLVDDLEVSDRLIVKMLDMEGMLNLKAIRQTLNDYFMKCGKLK